MGYWPPRIFHFISYANTTFEFIYLPQISKTAATPRGSNKCLSLHCHITQPFEKMWLCMCMALDERQKYSRMSQICIIPKDLRILSILGYPRMSLYHKNPRIRRFLGYLGMCIDCHGMFLALQEAIQKFPDCVSYTLENAW